MNGDASNVITYSVNLADVDTDPHREIVPQRRASDRGSASDGSGGGIEDRKEPVSGRFHLTSLEPLQLRSHSW